MPKKIRRYGTLDACRGAAGTKVESFLKAAQAKEPEDINSALRFGFSLAAGNAHKLRENFEEPNFTSRGNDKKEAEELLIMLRGQRNAVCLMQAFFQALMERGIQNTFKSDILGEINPIELLKKEEQACFEIRKAYAPVIKHKMRQERKNKLGL
jgi:hypothetical protein